MKINNGRIQSKGYAMKSAKGKFIPFKFQRRPVGPKDVLIDISYCGICHSDVHNARSEWGKASYPIVPGHEIVGKVARVGSSVKKFQVGNIVGVGCMVDSCRKCKPCRMGAEYYCRNGGPVWTYDSNEKHIGGTTYGGYSNNIVVDEAFVLRIPRGVDLAATAPLMCAGTTTYTPLKYWKVGPGQKVGILGLGGLGHIALKIAKSMGAEVIVFTSSNAKCKDAMRLGATKAVLTSNKKEMKKYHGSLDLVLDTASSKHNVDEYLRLLNLNGKLVLVGLPNQPLEVSPFSLVSGHHILAGSSLGGIQETQEMLDYCAKHRISSDIELIPIRKVNEAFRRLVKGDVRYRFVIDMSSLK